VFIWWNLENYSNIQHVKVSPDEFRARRLPNSSQCLSELTQLPDLHTLVVQQHTGHPPPADYKDGGTMAAGRMSSFSDRRMQ
jgi:hypothetical protein